MVDLYKAIQELRAELTEVDGAIAHFERLQQLRSGKPRSRGRPRMTVEQKRLAREARQANLQQKPPHPV